MTVTEIHKIAEGFHHAECPRWHDGHLYFSDMDGHRVYRISEDDTVSTVVEAPEPGGLGFTPDGDLLIVSMSERVIYRFDGSRLVLHADLKPHGCVRLNDMVVDGQGRAYVGDIGLSSVDQFANPTDPRRLGPQKLYRVDPDGSVSQVADGVICPNGMAITPDGSTLVVSETFAFRMSAFEIFPDGRLSEQRTFAAFRDTPATSMSEVTEADVKIPDGIAVDAEGAIWMGDANGPGVSRIGDGGVILDHVDFPGAIFACALGGSDRRTLYLLGGGPNMASLLRREYDRREQALNAVYKCTVSVPGAGWP